MLDLFIFAVIDIHFTIKENDCLLMVSLYFVTKQLFASCSSFNWCCLMYMTSGSTQKDLFSFQKNGFRNEYFATTLMKNGGEVLVRHFTMKVVTLNSKTD